MFSKSWRIIISFVKYKRIDFIFLEIFNLVLVFELCKSRFKGLKLCLGLFVFVSNSINDVSFWFLEFLF